MGGVGADGSLFLRRQLQRPCQGGCVSDLLESVGSIQPVYDGTLWLYSYPVFLVALPSVMFVFVILSPDLLCGGNDL